MSGERTPSWVDRVGACLSIACAVHCIATPLVAVAAPFLTSAWSHPLAHILPCLFVVPMGLVVALQARRGKRLVLAVCAVLGVVLVTGGTFLPLLPEPAAVQARVSPDAPSPAPADGHADCCPQLVREPETGALRVQTSGAGLAVLGGSLLLAAAHLWSLMRRLRAGSCCEMDACAANQPV